MAFNFITNHGRVLLAVAVDPTRTIRQIAAEVGVTERATHRVITNLTEAGYLERVRVGRRVNYRLNLHKLHLEPAERASEVRDLVSLLALSIPEETEPDGKAGAP